MKSLSNFFRETKNYRRLNGISFFFFLFLLDSFTSFLPYLKYFSFEYAVFNSIFITLFSGYFLLSLISPEVNQNPPLLIRLIKFCSIVFVPIFYSLFASLLYDNCLEIEGLYYYLLIAAPSPIIGFSIAAAVKDLKWKRIIFIFVYMILLFGWVQELYFNPQIYFYNPILAFFPGTIYDDYIPIDRPLILYRLFTLVISLFIIYFFLWSSYSKSTLKATVGRITLVLIYAGCFFIYPLLGWSTTESKLNSLAKTKIEGENFKIFVYDNLPAARLNYIKALHSYYIGRLETKFGKKNFSGLRTYLFINDEQKKELFGTSSADVAKPWQKAVFLTLDSYSDNLEHEMAHIAASGFSDNLPGVSANLDFSLIEGFAVAATEEYNGEDIHALSALYLQYDTAFFKSGSNSVKFFNLSPTAGYIFSGSFIAFLSEQFGPNPLEVLYRTGDYEQAYHKKMNELLLAYRKFIENRNVRYDSLKANFYFNSPPVLKRYCPRYIASKFREASELAISAEYRKAIEVYDKIISKTEDPRAYWGKINLMVKSKNYSGAHNEISSVLKHGKGGRLNFYFEVLKADLDYLRSDKDHSMSEYNRLAGIAPTEKIREMVQLRILLYSRKELHNYLTGDLQKKNRIIENQTAFANQPVLLSALIDLNDTKFLSGKIFYPPTDQALPDTMFNAYSIRNIAGYFEKNLLLKEAASWLNFGIAFAEDTGKYLMIKDLERVTLIELFIKQGIH